jgi:RHS repeat-associated protein
LFTFAGEQVDDELELVFLRARYYDPQVGRFIGRDKHSAPYQTSQVINRYIYTVNNPAILVDPSGFSYAYHSVRFAAFLGLGATVQRTEYWDPVTGETKVLWNAGFGAGLPGVKLSTDVGESTGNIPREGMSLQTHAGLDLVTGVSGAGVSGELDLASGKSSSSAQFGYTKMTVSSDTNLAAAGYLGVGSEASGTFNVTFRRGTLGDWLFDQFAQPYYDMQLYRNQQEHYRRMTEITQQRSEYRTGAVMGALSSSDK